MTKAAKIFSIAAVGLAMGLTASTASAIVPYDRFQLSDAEYESLISREYDRCIEASGGITIKMRDCASAEQDRLDRKLNIAYRKAMAGLPNQAAKAKLRNLERQWLATRWDSCHRDAEQETGTIGLLMLDGCGLYEMQRRVTWLERYAG